VPSHGGLSRCIGFGCHGQPPQPEAVSSMTGIVGQAGRIEPEQFHCRNEALG
jgi:hypothetical protein